MADEVTRKDLQSLQGYCNKQVADVNKVVGKHGDDISDLKATLKDVKSSADRALELCDGFPATYAPMFQKINERLAALEKRLAALG